MAEPPPAPKCDVCHHVYKTWESVRRHKKRTNCSTHGKQECDQCGAFMLPTSIYRHKKISCPMRKECAELDARIEARIEAKVNERIDELALRRNQEGSELMVRETRERTVRLPQGAKFTNTQAINLMRLAGAHPIGVDGSHEVDAYIVEKLIQEVKFPQPDMKKDERIKKTARVLQAATRAMMSTHQGSRNMVMAADLGYRMVYLYVTLAVGDTTQAALESKTLADAILMSFTLSLEAISEHLSTKLGKEWEKVAVTLEQTFKENGGQIVSMSKDDFERTLHRVYEDVDTCLTSTPLWRKETERQRRRNKAAIGVVPV